MIDIKIALYISLKQEDEKFTLQIWSDEDHKRNVTTINFDHDDISEDGRQYPGKEVLCGLQFDNTHILATSVSILYHPIIHCFCFYPWCMAIG